ncbi:MAG: hypothetical protein AAGD10_21095 [Myxococcota bacterium]
MERRHDGRRGLLPWGDVCAVTSTAANRPYWFERLRRGLEPGSSIHGSGTLVEEASCGGDEACIVQARVDGDFERPSSVEWSGKRPGAQGPT